MPVLSRSTMASPELLSDGKVGDVTVDPKDENFVNELFAVTIAYSFGRIIFDASVDGIPPSEIVQPERLKGFWLRLKISMNSDSGNPTTGLGSAKISVMIMSLKFAACSLKYKNS